MDTVHRTRQDLRNKMDKESITGEELLESVRQSFFLIQREYYSRRQDDSLSSSEIMERCYGIVDESFDQNGISDSMIIVSALKQVIENLNIQFEFAQDSELVQRHDYLLHTLIEKYQNSNPA